jgi:hypothetical protein
VRFSLFVPMDYGMAWVTDLTGWLAGWLCSTVYDIMLPTGTNYLAFMCWIGL